MMNVKYNTSPFPYLVFKDLFGKDINKQILEEAVKNKDSFQKAGTSIGGVVSNFRTNAVCFYDGLYKGDRSKSVLLKSLDTLFRAKQEFREIVSTAPFPMTDFQMCNSHETQVSRYGEEHLYEWHQDRFANINRHVSLVYYFFKEPKKWSGGNLSITDSPAYRDTLIDKDPNIVELVPENDMGVVFAATSLHKVNQTSAPEKFEYGRFSANIWIGFS